MAGVSEGASEDTQADDGRHSMADTTAAGSSTDQSQVKLSTKCEKEVTSSSKGNNIMGKINNLISADLNTLEGAQTYILVGELSKIC